MRNALHFFFKESKISGITFCYYSLNVCICNIEGHSRLFTTPTPLHAGIPMLTPEEVYVHVAGEIHFDLVSVGETAMFNIGIQYY